MIWVPKTPLRLKGAPDSARLRLRGCRLTWCQGAAVGEICEHLAVFSIPKALRTALPACKRSSASSTSSCGAYRRHSELIAATFGSQGGSKQHKAQAQREPRAVSRLPTLPIVDEPCQGALAYVSRPARSSCCPSWPGESLAAAVCGAFRRET